MTTTRASYTALRRVAGVVALLLVAACERQQLLGVNTPDQIRPEDATSPQGAAALRAGALRDFAQFYGGTTNVGVNIYVGLLSDELINARPGADHIDQRAFNENTFPAAAWNKFSDTYTQTVRAIRALNQFVAASATRSRDIGQLYALQGISLNIAGELFCNGVPLSTVNDAAPEAATLVSTTQLYQRAIVQADSALAVLGTAAADQTFRYLARVAKARAQLNLGQFDAAATTVGAGGDGAGSAAVPTNWQYAVEFSQTTLVNTVFDWMVNTANFGPSDREGGNGLDFRSARDPRVQTSATFRLGQDGSTQVFTVLGYPNGSAPSILVSGVTARMIEAEAALRRGDAVAFLAKLNEPRADAAVRAARNIGTGADVLPPLTDPGTADARITLLFRERAFWFYLNATRVGDLRRLQRQYNRQAAAVWPTGAYFKGGTYGTDVTLTPSFAERNNTAFTGCADRNP
jgi:starch-binding outer membrane protein, SusD/RagB family